MADLFAEGGVNINLDKVICWGWSKGDYSSSYDFLWIEFDSELQDGTRIARYYRKDYPEVEGAFHVLESMGNVKVTQRENLNG